MTQSPVTVTYSLEEVLGQINQKLDTLQKDVNDIKVGQARLEERLTGEIKTLSTKVDGLETKFDSLDKRIDKIENTQKNQVWTLITLLGGSLITVAFRFFLSSNNP